MIKNNLTEFSDGIKKISKDRFSNLFYFVPIIVFMAMPLTGLVLIQLEIDKILLGWFLSISSIFIFGILLLHSEWMIPLNRHVFLIAFFNGYMLEFVLVNILEKYSYHNLPLLIFNVPLLIPLGWVSAFYSTSISAHHLLRKLNIDNSSLIDYSTIFVLGVIYGFFLEKLAADKNLWDFHFTSISLFSVPLLATLAWGLTLSNFDFGMNFIQGRKYNILVVILVIFLLNLIVAWILLYFL